MKEFLPAVYGGLGYSKISENGYTKHQVYWFKVEPIKWRILTTSGNSAYIMSDIALDAFWLEPNRGEPGFYNGEYGFFRKDQNGNMDGTYANNWEYCFLRQWLNETFYNEVSTICKRKSYRPRASTTAREVAIRTNTRRITRILTARKTSLGKTSMPPNVKIRMIRSFCCL